jgi:hypothetical protein
MPPDAASLENLRDIVVPQPVTWWPPAPGWWVVMSISAIAVFVVAFRAWRVWRANAYRRAALHELPLATTVTGIAEIVKRTALVAYSRTDIAALSGSNWSQWLGEAGGGQVPDQVAEALTQGVFGKVDNVNIGEVRVFAADWIKHHRNQTEFRKGSKET